MFVERRWQPWWLLGLLVTIALSLAVAYGAAISSLIGWALAFVLSAVAVTFWYSMRSHIVVNDLQVKVGRMRLELEYIAKVEAFESNEFLTRSRSSARAYDMFSLLGGSRGGIVISLNDDTDPIKAWVVSSRKPHDLANAIDLARITVG